MGGSATQVALAGVTVTATSPDTYAAIDTVRALVNVADADVYTYVAGTTIPATTASGPHALVFASSVTGNVAIPSGWDYVVAAPGSSATLTGGERFVTTVVGDGFDFSGLAPEVVSGSGDSTIIDGATAATILLGSTGHSTVTANGPIDVVQVGALGTASITLNGPDDTIVAGPGSTVEVSTLGVGETVSIAALGSASVMATGGSFETFDVQASSLFQAVVTNYYDTFNFSPGPSVAKAAGLGAAPAPVVFTNVVAGQAGRLNTYNVTDGASVDELVLGMSDTVNSSAGLSTIFGLNGDVINAASGVFFVGPSTVVGVASTIVGGAGASTVFANSAVEFDLGAAQANVFVGGTAASTINAGAGGGSFFGGTAGDDYNIGTGAAQVFVGLGGEDTLNGVAGSAAPTIFALNAERLWLTATTNPETIVSFANGGTIDTSSTSGDNVIFAGYGIGGNQTLVGSPVTVDAAGAGTHDVFVVGAASMGSPAATITIQNFHGGDVLYLGGFTAGDVATMDAAIGNSVGLGAAGSLSFTLGDKTTITFVGGQPTNFAANSAF